MRLAKQRIPYRSLEDNINLIRGENWGRCHQIIEKYRKLFKAAPGSSHNHQAWIGGYWDHIEDCLNIAVILYERLNAVRPLPFSLPDALLVLFLHDIEKPWRYQATRSPKYIRVDRGLEGKKARAEFRLKLIKKHGIKLTPEQQNALKYVEGEGDDYTGDGRTMGPLAAFCHMVDTCSARLWFDFPQKQGDPWAPQRFS